MKKKVAIATSTALTVTNKGREHHDQEKEWPIKDEYWPLICTILSQTPQHPLHSTIKMAPDRNERRYCSVLYLGLVRQYSWAAISILVSRAGNFTMLAWDIRDWATISAAIDTNISNLRHCDFARSTSYSNTIVSWFLKHATACPKDNQMVLY